MGAWGTGLFDDDAALDFVFDIVRSRGIGLLQSALVAAGGSSYRETKLGVRALAAAEALTFRKTSVRSQLESWSALSPTLQ